MPAGRGRYDELATYVREHSQGDAVAVIVFNGVRGHGFSVQSVTPELVQRLPEMLRYMADEIERSMRDG